MYIENHIKRYTWKKISAANPVVDRVRVVDFFAETLNELRRGPLHALVRVLLVHHLVENWSYPIFEQAIVVVRNEKIAEAIDTLRSKLLSWKNEKIIPSCIKMVVIR